MLSININGLSLSEVKKKKKCKTVPNAFIEIVN